MKVRGDWGGGGGVSHHDVIFCSEVSRDDVR